jgi:hypothetical protein
MIAFQRPVWRVRKVHPRSKNLTEVVRESTNDIRRVTPVGASGDEPSIIAFNGLGRPERMIRSSRGVARRRSAGGLHDRPARSAAAPVARQVAPDQGLKRDSRAGRLDWALSSAMGSRCLSCLAGRFAIIPSVTAAATKACTHDITLANRKRPRGALSRCLRSSVVTSQVRSLALWKRQTASPAFRRP